VRIDIIASVGVQICKAGTCDGVILIKTCMRIFEVLHVCLITVYGAGGKEDRGKLDYREANIERASSLKGTNRTTVLAEHHKTMNRPGEE